MAIPPKGGELGDVGTPGYTAFRDALAKVESAGHAGAVQRTTKAQGLFQFIPRYWDTWSKKHLNRDIKSFMPKDESKEELARAHKEQTEILFPAYYEKEIKPFISKARKSGAGADMTDTELAAVFHKLGASAGMKFLKTGFDASEGTPDNEPIRDYIRKVVRRTGANPSEVIASTKAITPITKKGDSFATGPAAQIVSENEQVLTNPGKLQAAQGMAINDRSSLSDINKETLARLQILSGQVNAENALFDFEARLRKEGSGV